jgi:hypoxanthine phosphoribosyltransferase
MKRIKVLDREFELYLPSEKIGERIKEMAVEISADLKDKNPVFIAILNGSFMFASDLFRSLEFDAQITFLKLSSYDGTSTSGSVKQLIGLNQDLKDRDVVILEDIVDTGVTLVAIIRQLGGYSPASVRVAALMYKPDACREDVAPDYYGFTVPDDFYIGYGLDYNGHGRKYEDIYVLVKKG